MGSNSGLREHDDKPPGSAPEEDFLTM